MSPVETLEKPEVLVEDDLEEVVKAAIDQGLISEEAGLTGNDMETVIPIVDHGSHWQDGCSHYHTEIV